MTRVRVQLPAAAEAHYDVVIGRGVLSTVREWTAEASRVVVVSDGVVEPLWRPRVEAVEALPDATPWIVIPSGESHKTLETTRDVWQAFEDHQLDRNSVVINFGGGVVGDLGGFAAACFLRGIDFIQVPTTLLAQVDASVGGKVGVDFRHGKNRIGAFAAPRGVIIDLETLTTLDRRNYRSGFAEVLKHGLIRDRDYFNSLDLAVTSDARIGGLESIVRRSVEIKSEVVSRDVRESGLRKILNFGHTAGHAIESIALAGPSPLLHGEAVAIGMVIASRLSHRVGLLSGNDCEAIECRIETLGLPTRIPASVDIDGVLKLIPSDKKSTGGSVGWTLLSAIGEAVFDQPVEWSLVEEAVRRVSEASHS